MVLIPLKMERFSPWTGQSKCLMYNYDLILLRFRLPVKSISDGVAAGGLTVFRYRRCCEYQKIQRQPVVMIIHHKKLGRKAQSEMLEVV